MNDIDQEHDSIGTITEKIYAELRAASGLTLDICDAFNVQIKQLESENARLKVWCETWYEFALILGKIVKCLPSSFPDGNKHIVKSVMELKESNVRLKALLVTASFLLDSYADVFGYGRAYERFVREFKKEGIE